MDIKLIPVGKKTKFVFPTLPEQIKCKSTSKYQSFDIISQGTIKVPKGTEVKEISWEGEFFGESKKKEAIVKKNAWKKPSECVKILEEFMKSGTVLNLIVTDTWINIDVTISSFQSVAYGAYGNIRYSITFIEKKLLKIYDTSELNIASFEKKTKPRNEPEPESTDTTYIVQKGDTLWGIAQTHFGSGIQWTRIYDANTEIIEETARQYGRADSDHGHWIYPGTTLTIPA